MRSPLLGTARDVELRQGTLRYHVRGTGPPIVFLHGVFANANLWRHVVDELATRFSCVTLDLPLGAHERPMPVDADLSPPALASMVAEFIEAVGLRDVTLVGNDSGGALCQMVVTSHPDRVGRLVLTSCDAFEIWLPRMFRPLEWSAWLPPVLWLLLQPLRLRRLRRLPIAFGWLSKRPIPAASSDSYVLPALHSSPIRRDLAKVLRGIDPAYTLRAAEQLHSFDRPALVAWAKEDRFFPVRHARALAARLPRAELALIDDSFTFVPEDRPSELARRIRAFVLAAAPFEESERQADVPASLLRVEDGDAHANESARRDSEERHEGP